MDLKAHASWQASSVGDTTDSQSPLVSVPRGTTGSGLFKDWESPTVLSLAIALRGTEERQLAGASVTQFEDLGKYVSGIS